MYNKNRTDKNKQRAGKQKSVSFPRSTLSFLSKFVSLDMSLQTSFRYFDNVVSRWRIPILKKRNISRQRSSIFGERNNCFEGRNRFRGNKTLFRGNEVRGNETFPREWENKITFKVNEILFQGNEKHLFFGLYYLFFTCPIKGPVRPQ